MSKPSLIQRLVAGFIGLMLIVLVVAGVGFVVWDGMRRVSTSYRVNPRIYFRAGDISIACQDVKTSGWCGDYYFPGDEGHFAIVSIAIQCSPEEGSTCDLRGTFPYKLQVNGDTGRHVSVFRRNEETVLALSDQMQSKQIRNISLCFELSSKEQASELLYYFYTDEKFLLFFDRQREHQVHFVFP